MASAATRANLGLPNVPSHIYRQSQKKTMSELYDVIRKMLAVDKELQQTIHDFDKAGEDLKSNPGKDRAAWGRKTKADMQSLAQEFDTVLRQMTRLCIGRQGNHFPLLSREYFHGGIKDIGTRENVVHALAWVESIDCEAFCRPYKSALNQYSPLRPPGALLRRLGRLLGALRQSQPGDEPRPRRHTRCTRRTSPSPCSRRSRICAGRWRRRRPPTTGWRKGLTGNYYQWFQSRKIRGDVKEFFIQDYIIWITKESEGIQKLEKEIRGIFWRYMPFSKEIKEKLKTRSYVYQELYQKDVNRSMSDGY